MAKIEDDAHAFACFGVNGQCQAILGDGKRCKNAAASGCAYCWMHRK